MTVQFDTASVKQAMTAGGCASRQGAEIRRRRLGQERDWAERQIEASLFTQERVGSIAIKALQPTQMIEKELADIGSIHP